MHNFDIRRLKSTLLVLAGIGTAFVFWQILHSPTVALILLCSVVIVSTFHAAIYLYLKNDSMMGGLPQANYSYALGWVVLTSGNVITCWTFVSAHKEIAYFGSVLLVAGTGMMVGANFILFKHIIRRGLRSPQ